MFSPRLFNSSLACKLCACLIGLLPFSAVTAQEKADVAATTPPTSLERHYEMTLNYKMMAKTKFAKNNRPKNERFSYAQESANFLILQPLSEKNSLFGGIGYSSAKLTWDQNPAFKHKTYSYVNLLLGGTSREVENWLWEGKLIVSLDPHSSRLDTTTWYNGFFFGRYTYTKNVGIYIGFNMYTGLNKDMVYPILGFDYIPNKEWKLSLIYPTDISLTYTITPEWSAIATLRPILDRHRLKRTEAVPFGVYEYSTNGTEVALKWAPSLACETKLFVGSTTGGRLKITDKLGRNGQIFKLRPAPYAGLTVVVRF